MRLAQMGLKEFRKAIRDIKEVTEVVTLRNGIEVLGVWTPHQRTDTATKDLVDWGVPTKEKT